MTVDEAHEKLENFVRNGKVRTIFSDVHLNGNFAYATDGKIALRASVDQEVKKDSDDFPFNRIDDFVQLVYGASQWMAMDLDKFTEISGIFLKAWTDDQINQRKEITGRYKRLQCPCCGGEVYWDKHFDVLVEFDDLEEVDYNPANLYFPVRLNLQDGTYLDVLFGYLFLINKAFGTEVLFSKEVAKEGDISRLFIKTSNGEVKGILMPLRATEDDLVPKYIIDTHAHECCVKEVPSDGKEN